MSDFSQVRFVKSCVEKTQFLLDKPIVTFIGRSNVGKSSLINALVRRKSLMKTSKMAGLTTMINYCIVDEKFYLVDVPGYGYATKERDFETMMESFLDSNKALKKVYLLIDSRRLLVEADDEFSNHLQDLNIDYSFVFTKVDKLTMSDKHYLKMQIDKLAPKECFLTSCKDDKSIMLLRNDILKTISKK